MKSWIFLCLVVLSACAAPAVPEYNLSEVFGISAITTDQPEYTPIDLVNISVMVRNERLLNYTLNVTLLRDGQVDYTQSSYRDSVSRQYERWNIWKEKPDGGNWSVLVELQPQFSSVVMNASTVFIVRHTVGNTQSE
ncbi:MAG: hypothetical protein Q7R96_02695 [Nanoarchaeota archaeon]|nr:hypothetical protein [Nanoarchaeota archaeon]